MRIFYLVNHVEMRYFQIDAESCNVHDITEKTRRAFQNDNLVLVQSNGLKIESSEATSGNIYII